MTSVKICGITTLEDALAACESGADALGFNFADEAAKKRRYIEPQDAARIIRDLPPFVTTVGICVNPSRDDVARFLEIVDRVQFHGDEDAAFCEPFASRAIKAFRVGAEFDVRSLEGFPAQAVLLDAYAAGMSGGTGATFDWTVAASAVQQGHRVILAGGLTPDNVAEAVRQVRPYGVDTAGGVESAPGKKDHEKISRFVRNAKDALSVS